MSEGTFFVWFRLPEPLTPERLLEEHRVAVAPGEGFGAGWRGWPSRPPTTRSTSGMERLRCALAT